MRDYNAEIVSKKRSRRLRAVLILSVLTFLIFGGAVFYVVFFTKLLFFKEIKIQGLHNVTEGELFFTHPYLFQSINISHPLIKSWSVKKDFVHRILFVDAKEREPFAIWCIKHEATESSCFWIDDEGVIFASAPNTEGSLVRSVEDLSGRSLKPGDFILKEPLRKNLFNAFAVLDSAGIEALKYELGPLENEEITVFVKEGPKIYFSLRFNPSFAADPIKSLVPKFATLSYIDLRSENRVFYK